MEWSPYRTRCSRSGFVSKSRHQYGDNCRAWNLCSSGSPCDPKWWDIGIRIEDDILVTKNGPVNLSAAAPRAWDEIEKLMAEESPLDDFKLPALEIN